MIIMLSYFQFISTYWNAIRLFQFISIYWNTVYLFQFSLIYWNKELTTRQGLL